MELGELLGYQQPCHLYGCVPGKAIKDSRPQPSLHWEP